MAIQLADEATAACVSELGGDDVRRELHHVQREPTEVMAGRQI